MKKVFSLGFLLIFAVCCDCHALQYRLTDLGTLGGVSSKATDINESGQVVGEAYDSGDVVRAFLWDSSNGMVNIGGSSEAGATGINDNGTVIGCYFGGALPFRWSQAGGFEPLSTARPEYPTYNYGAVYGISNSGVASGHRGGDCPTYWDASGTAIPLSLYSGRQYAIAGDFTDTSHMVGAAYTYDANGTNHLAVYWTSPSNIGLFSMLSGAVESNPRDINDLNQTVGWNKDAQGVFHAVLWDTFTSAPIELGLGQAMAITDDGTTIIGLDGDDSPVMWFYEEGQWSQAYDLNDMLDTEGWTITGLAAINTGGYIAATASDGVDTRAVLLSPYEAQAVPEPLTVISLFVAFIALRLKKRQ